MIFFQALSVFLFFIALALAFSLVREKKTSRGKIDAIIRNATAQTLDAERRNRLTLNISSTVGSVVLIKAMIPQILDLLSDHFKPAEVRLVDCLGKNEYCVLFPNNKEEKISGKRGILEMCGTSGFLPPGNPLTPLLAIKSENQAFQYNLPIISDDRFSGNLVLANRERLNAVDQRFLGNLVPVLTAALRNKRMADRFDSAVDWRVRDHLMAGSKRPAGELREAGILFVDIVGFTTQAENLPPEKIVSFLNEFFSRCQECVNRNNGLINKFLGDGFMAIFGAPRDDPDYAISLLETGISILEEAVKLAEVARSYGMSNFTVSLGGETGNVLAGTVGSADRMEYTLIGDTVNVASRLEGLTRFFGVRFLAGEALRKKADGWYFRNLGRIKPKGKANALNIFEVLGPRDSISQEKIDEIARFEKALSLYKACHFREALDAWTTEREDPAVKWYRARANENILNPPAENWDGSEIFRSK